MIPELLIETAEEIKKIDDQIAQMAALADYAGSLKVNIPTVGLNGFWEGYSDIICGAVSKQVIEDIEDLKHRKSILISDLSTELVKEIKVIYGED